MFKSPLVKCVMLVCLAFVTFAILSSLVSCTLSFTDNDTEIKGNTGTVTDTQTYDQTQTPTNDVQAEATIPLSGLV